METTFNASAIAVVDPDGLCFLVGFADDATHPHHYLMLQRAFEDDVDDQDVELGHDTYHVEWCDQSCSLYGGIAHFVLHRDGAECKFSPEGTLALAGAVNVRIGFDLDEPEFRRLKQRLSDIFRGTTCFQVQA